MKLENQVALITGSTRGIGKAIALKFASEGAKVVVVGTKENKGLVADTLAKHGKIDILINNASTDDPLVISGIQDIEMDMYNRVMNVNVKAPFLLCKIVIPEMEKQGKGVVINTCSVASTGACRGPLVYTVSKHAMLGLTRELSLYHGPKGIRVNAVLPGGVATDMIAGDMNEENPAVMKIKMSPASRLATTDEIANVMLFLASDEASYIHGTGITVDGGFTLM